MTRGTGAGLGVMVVMVMMMVVPTGRERRACTDQHQKRDKDDLLHAMKIARTRSADMPRKMQESSPPRVPWQLPVLIPVSHWAKLAESGNLQSGLLRFWMQNERNPPDFGPSEEDCDMSAYTNRYDECRTSPAGF